MPFRCRACQHEWLSINPGASDCPACGAEDAGEIRVEISPDAERSPGGSVIYRHEAREEGAYEAAHGNEETIEAVTAHIERHIGPVDSVFHEIVSDMVHIDVYRVAPTAERPYYTLLTSGMSDRPMTTPPGAEDWRFGELCLCLPPDWPLEKEQFEQEENYWPVRGLKSLARLPHEYRTWLGWGHTVPNGDPPEAFSEKARFDCWMLMQPQLFGEEFHSIEVGERRIWFFAIVPLYPEETNHKLQYGADDLVQRFFTHGVTELIDVNRPSVCQRSNKWW